MYKFILCTLYFYILVELITAMFSADVFADDNVWWDKQFESPFHEQPWLLPLMPTLHSIIPVLSHSSAFLLVYLAACPSLVFSSCCVLLIACLWYLWEHGEFLMWKLYFGLFYLLAPWLIFKSTFTPCNKQFENLSRVTQMFSNPKWIYFSVKLKIEEAGFILNVWLVWL